LSLSHIVYYNSFTNLDVLPEHCALFLFYVTKSLIIYSVLSADYTSNFMPNVVTSVAELYLYLAIITSLVTCFIPVCH
jgi:hypothetical protein